VVDQDQSDNLPTQYLITTTGTTAQNTAANRNTLPSATVLDNGSDERLVVLMDAGLGCTPWLWPDIADNQNPVPSLPANELMATYKQPSPIALVPANDPMTTIVGVPSLNKVNLYRAGVNQPMVGSLVGTDADAFKYCMRLGRIFPSRFFTSSFRKLLTKQPSPDGVSPNLYVFLAIRFVASFGPDNLNCTGLLGVDIMVSVMTNGTGYPIDATVDVADILPTLPEDGAYVPPTSARNNTSAGFSIRPQVGFSVLSVIFGFIAAFW